MATSCLAGGHSACQDLLTLAAYPIWRRESAHSDYIEEAVLRQSSVPTKTFRNNSTPTTDIRACPKTDNQQWNNENPKSRPGEPDSWTDPAPNPKPIQRSKLPKPSEPLCKGLPQDQGPLKKGRGAERPEGGGGKNPSV